MHKSIYHQISGFNILLSRTIIQRATDGDHPFFTRKCQIVIVCTVFLDGCFLLFPSSQHTTIRTHWTKKTTKFWSHWIRAEVCLLRYYIVLTQHIAFQNVAKWKIDKNIAVPKKVVFRVGNEDRQFLYLSSNYQSVKPRIWARLVDNGTIELIFCKRWFYLQVGIRQWERKIRH